MYEFFKNIAEENDWHFEYSREDYQNLSELEVGQIGLYVDPIITESKFSSAGNESLTFSGRFMILMNSDVDESYIDKYNNYIEPLKQNQLQLLKDEISCSNYEIKSWKTLEVINYFDSNVDGVLINYNISLID